MHYSKSSTFFFFGSFVLTNWHKEILETIITKERHLHFLNCDVEPSLTSLRRLSNLGRIGLH